MRFKKYLEKKSLNEGASSDVYERYKKMMSLDEFNRIISLDPTIKEKNGVVYTGSYLQWLVSTIYKTNKNSLTSEVTKLLDFYGKLKNKNKKTPDITKFETVESLKDFISSLVVNDNVALTGDKLDWVLTQYNINKESVMSDIIELISSYNKILNKQPETTPAFESFKTVQELQDFVDMTAAEVDEETFKKEQKVKKLFHKTIIHGGYDIFTFNSYEASKKLFGRDEPGVLVASNWCTAWPPSDGGDGQYNRYTSSGNLYVIRDRNKQPAEYWQVHIANEQQGRGSDYQFQWQDEHDSAHAGTDFVNWIKDKQGLKDYFKSKLKASESVMVGARRVFFKVNEQGVREFGDIKFEHQSSLIEIPLEMGDGNPYTCTSFDVSATGITSLKNGPIKVTNEFKCSKTKIVNLEGAPESVGSFDCNDNPELVSLHGAPNTEGDFDCSGCPKLESTEGIGGVGGDLKISNSGIKSLKGLEDFGGNDISADGCDDLINLVGLPSDKVHGLKIDASGIASLKGCPTHIEKDFSLRKLDNLISFKDSPRSVGGKFDAGWCQNVATCEGLPEKIGKSLVLTHCKKLSSLKGITPRKNVGDFVGLGATAIPEEEIKKYQDSK